VHELDRCLGLTVLNLDGRIGDANGRSRHDDGLVIGMGAASTAGFAPSRSTSVILSWTRSCWAANTGEVMPQTRWRLSLARYLVVELRF
jgi:hypothetical protein